MAQLGKYSSLQEYMERTRTNANQLIEKVRRLTGETISAPMMSMILRGSRRCSLRRALILSHVTGVPVDVLRKWPNCPVSDSSQSEAKSA